MSSEITANSLVGGDLYDYQSLIFKDAALLNAGAKVSSEFLLAQAAGRAQLNIVAGVGGCVIAATKTLVISVATADVSGGTFDNVIFTKTIPAGTYAAGELITSFVSSREVSEVYTKLTITSDFDATAQKVTAYQVQV